MNYTKPINKVINYIEENLEKRLELKHLAEVANISPYHFHRVFSKETGEKVNDYIIRRRLTQANFDLLDTNDYLIDISLKYGFDSPQSFSRSFKKLFKQSPLVYRKGEIVKIDQVKTKLTYSGDDSFNYKIIKKRSLHLSGYEIDNDDRDTILTQVNVLFYYIYNDLKNNKLIPTENCMYMVSDDMTFLGVPTDMKFKLEENMVTRDIPEMKYIVFEHIGPVDKIERTYKNIYEKWLPSLNNIEIEDTFVISAFDEIHFPDYFDITVKDDYICEKIEHSDGFSDSFYYEILIPLKE